MITQTELVLFYIFILYIYLGGEKSCDVKYALVGFLTCMLFVHAAPNGRAFYHSDSASLLSVVLKV